VLGGGPKRDNCLLAPSVQILEPYPRPSFIISPQLLFKSCYIILCGDPSVLQITRRVRKSARLHPSSGTVLFMGEGPRSRCYGRTAALRRIVQPCDEDEKLSVFF
jgi:hypothetical protein